MIEDPITLLREVYVLIKDLDDRAADEGDESGECWVFWRSDRIDSLTDRIKTLLDSIR